MCTIQSMWWRGKLGTASFCPATTTWNTSMQDLALWHTGHHMHKRLEQTFCWQCILQHRGLQPAVPLQQQQHRKTFLQIHELFNVLLLLLLEQNADHCFFLQFLHLPSHHPNFAMMVWILPDKYFLHCKFPGASNFSLLFVGKQCLESPRKS